MLLLCLHEEAFNINIYSYRLLRDPDQGNGIQGCAYD